MVASVVAVTLAQPASAAGEPDGRMNLSGSDYLVTSSFSNGTGDMDFIFYAAADDWSSGTQVVVAHWPQDANKRSVRIQFNKDGHLQLLLNDKAGKMHIYNAYAGKTKLSNGKGYWFRVRLNVAVGSESVAKFFVSKQAITTVPTKVSWGTAKQVARGAKVTPRDASGTWTIGAAKEGTADRLKGDIAWLGFWRNGWATNGGKRAISLDMRTTKQASNNYAKWTETGRSWNVKGSNWTYEMPSDSSEPPPPPPTTTNPPPPPTSNEKPTAKTDKYTVTAGQTISITRSKLLSNDTDPEGDALSVKSVTSPSAAGVSVPKDGTKWTYKAPSGAGGTVDTITYRIQDTAGNVDAGQIKVTIEAAGNPGNFDVVIRPGDNIASIVNSKPSGTSFYIKAGKYRLAQIKPKEGMKFVGEPGAILSGAKKLTQFSQSGGLWYASGQTQGSGSKSEGSEWGRCESGYDMCVFPEQLFVGGQLLWQVKSKSQVAPGKWYFDYGNDKIWFADNPTGKTVETSVSTYAFWGSADNVHIEGLVMERYATPGRRGVVNAREGRTGSAGKNWTVKNNTIRWSHSYGIKVESGMDAIGNNIHHMGQMGIGGADASNLLISNNELSYTCISGFKCYGFAGGALKFDTVHNVTLRANYVHDNDGHGLHLDRESTNAVYEDNVIVNNTGNGIHHEISSGAIIRNNVIEGNGFRSGGHFGIIVLSSSDVEVYGNTLRGNRGGILGRQDGRTSISKLKNLWVHDNDITLDGTARVGIAIDGISDTSYFTSKNNRFTSNDYTFEYSTSFKPFKWIGGSVSVSTWKSKGMDKNGTFKWE